MRDLRSIPVRMVLGEPGDWHIAPTRANGQPAAAAYHRDRNGTYQADEIVVLTTTPDGISQILSVGNPELVSTFGFPPVLPAANTR
jgi:RNA polymerase sigma-70 factor, ECF subfamily